MDHIVRRDLTLCEFAGAELAQLMAVFNQMDKVPVAPPAWGQN
jgi:hypothetical protein